METKINKGISFVAKDGVSEDAKKKLKSLMDKKKENLSKMVESYNNGKFIAPE